MANSPCLWCERLWRVPAAHRVVSVSLVLLMARTRAATICGEFMIACLLASFLDSWCTIMAAWLTTTWSSSIRSLVSSGIALVARSASSYMKIYHVVKWRRSRKAFCSLQDLNKPDNFYYVRTNKFVSDKVRQQHFYTKTKVRERVFGKSFWKAWF